MTNEAERENTLKFEQELPQEPYIVLPDAEEIMRRLMAVDDNAYLASAFYPLIAKEANRELVADGVVLMFGVKILNFQEAGNEPILSFILNTKVPRFIDALVDDRGVAEKAKTFHRETMEAWKKRELSA